MYCVTTTDPSLSAARQRPYVQPLYTRVSPAKSPSARDTREISRIEYRARTRVHPRGYPSLVRVADVSIRHHTYTHLFHRNASCNLLAIRLSDCELSPRTRYIDLAPSPLYLAAIKMNFAPRRRMERSGKGEGGGEEHERSRSRSENGEDDDDDEDEGDKGSRRERGISIAFFHAGEIPPTGWNRASPFRENAEIRARPDGVSVAARSYYRPIDTDVTSPGARLLRHAN